MLFHQLAGNFFFSQRLLQSWEQLELLFWTAGQIHLLLTACLLKTWYTLHNTEYSPQMARSKLLLTYLSPLYNAFDKQNATHSMCLTDFPLPRRRYSIKRVPRPAKPLHTCSAFSKWVMLSNSAAEFEPGSIYTDISGLKLYSMRLK